MRGRPSIHATCLALLGVFAGPVCISAQTIVGQVTEAETGRLLQSALVMLVDTEGVHRGGALTDAGGEFRIRAPGAGEYRVQVERLGYETPPAEVVHLQAGEGVRVRLEMRPRPMAVDELQVSVERRRCVLRPDEGTLVAELWDEASKALRNQEWTERERRIRFSVREYVRELEPESRTVLMERRAPVRWTSGQPFRSLPAEDLLEGGFIREIEEEDGAFQYFGLDAAVLLSDAFLDTHCMRLAEASSEDLVGLAFEPVDEGSNDVRGMLWLDRDPLRPRFLEFTYTSSPWRAARGLAEGRVEFEELPGGNWIVRRWWIRMPRMIWDASEMGSGRSGYRVAGIVEEGGAVGEVQQARRTLRSAAPEGVVVGTVADSTGRAPAADVEVFLAGTSHEARTDTAGRFRIEGVHAGSYDVTVRDPGLSSLGFHPPARPVVVLEDDTTEVALALASREEMLKAICPALVEEDRWLALAGIVRDSRSGEPVPGARVDLEWKEYGLDGSGRRFVADVQTRQTASDGGGRYLVCGIPPGTRLEARAALGGREGPERIPRRLPYRSIVALDLTVDAGTGIVASTEEGVDSGREPRAEDRRPLDFSTPPGTITGRLFDVQSGRDLTAADVVLLDADGRAMAHTSSGGNGRFRIRAPGPGEYRIRVQRLGYETTTSPVLDLTGPEGLTVQYAMVAQPFAIEPIVVTVPAEAIVHPRLDFRGYYERKDFYGRRTGFGHFLDGDDLRTSATHVMHMLQEIPGLRIQTSPGDLSGRGFFATDRRGCRVKFFIDGQHVPPEDRRPQAPERLPLSVSEIVGVEFYPGRMVPIQFMTVGPGADCGVVAIWTGARLQGGG